MNKHTTVKIVGGGMAGILCVIVYWLVTSRQVWNSFKSQITQPSLVEVNQITELSQEPTQVTYQLVDGWNFIAFPIRPTTIKSASELTKSIRQVGGYVTTISRWNGDRWQTFSVRGNEVYGNDFPIRVGEAYFVLNHQPVEWIVSGKAVDADTALGTVSLKPGWNAVGIIPGTVASAQAVLDQLHTDQTETATEIDRWLSGNWDVLVKRWYSPTDIQAYGNDFPLEANRGYMIKSLIPATLRTNP